MSLGASTETGLPLTLKFWMVMFALLRRVGQVGKGRFRRVGSLPGGKGVKSTGKNSGNLRTLVPVARA